MVERDAVAMAFEDFSDTVEDFPNKRQTDADHLVERDLVIVERDSDFIHRLSVRV